MSLAVSDKHIPEWQSISAVYRTEVWSVGRPHVWCEVASSLTQWYVMLLPAHWLDMYGTQQHHSNMHHSLSFLATWNHTSAPDRLNPTRTNMFTRNQWGTSMSWSSTMTFKAYVRYCCYEGRVRTAILTLPS